MSHAELRLTIGPRHAGGYNVLAASGQGRSSGLFRLPASLADPEELFAFLDAACRHVNAAARWPVPLEGGRTEAEVRRRGQDLYRALFCDAIGELWQRSLGALSCEVSHLNLCIELVPEPDGTLPLASLPWEILFDGNDFLSCRRRTPVLRLLGNPAKEPSRPRPSPLRVLCVVAEPEDQVGLNLESELRGIEAAAHGRRSVEVILGRPASLAELAELIRGQGADIDVLHFAGHGYFDERSGKGALILRDKNGASEPVFGEHLADQLKDLPLRLAVLNACSTARAFFGRAGHPFVGVASALLQAIPAVVAMQVPIADGQAVAFAATLYRRLLHGESLELAVTEARLTLHSREPDRFDWAIPALYSRLSGGHVFTPSGGVSWTAVNTALRCYLGRQIAESTADAEFFVEPWCHRIQALAAVPPESLGDSPPPPPDAGPIRLEEILRAERSVVLLGEAGSGKSTLLQQIAARMAAARLEPGESESGALQPVPVLVPAALLLEARRQLRSPGLEAILGHAIGRLEPVPPDAAAALAEALPGLIEGGELVLLIDGVDEISDAARQSDLQQEIESFAAEWCTPEAGNRLLVASRSWPGSLRAESPIVAVELQPFDSGEREQLVRAWSVRLGLGAERLAAAIEETGRRSHGDLANPWFLSLLCRMIGNGSQDLPRHRVALCAAAVEALFVEWRRRAANDGGLPLPEEALAGILSAAAGEALSRSGALETEWLQILVRRRTPVEAASRVHQQLVEQSGFLTPLGRGSVRFRDRAFQDYFAAGLLVPEITAADPGLLVRALARPWREPLRLALGRAGMELEGAVLGSSLLTLLAQDAPPIPRAALWLASALPEMVTVPAGIAEELAERLLQAAAADEATLSAPLREHLEEVLVQLLAGGQTAAARNALAAALVAAGPEAGYRARAAARVVQRAGPLGDELAYLLPRALRHDDGSPDRPVDAALRALAARAPQRLPAAPGSLQQALRRDSSLLGRLRADPAWLRLTLALYGGFVPGGPFEPERIHRDSPLTKSLLTDLGSGPSGVSPTSPVPRLQKLWPSSPDPETAAEALFALAVLGEPVGADLASDDPRAVAARERLHHLVRVLRPLAAGAFGACLDSLQDSRTCPPELWSELLSGLLQVALAAGASPAKIRPLLPAVPAASRPAFLADLWHAHVAAPHPAYNFAVFLDVVGESLAASPWDLAKAMALAPVSVQAEESRRCGWALPAGVPETGTPQALLAAALDTVEALPAAFDFVVGWTLARLAPLLVEHQLGSEGLVLALGKLSDRMDARTEAATALLSAAPEAEIDLRDPDPGPALHRAIRSLAEGSARTAALRRLLRWFPELREAGSVPEEGRAAPTVLRNPIPVSTLFLEDAALTRPDGAGTPLLLFALLADLAQTAAEPAALDCGLADPSFPGDLSALAADEDLPRFRTFLALGGDRSETRRATSVLQQGAAALTALARSRIDHQRLHPAVAQAVDWALERVRHDDGHALATWADRLAQGGPGSPEAEVLLSRIHDLHSRAWPAFHDLLQASPLAVERALLHSLCFLAARRRLSPEQWRAAAAAVASWDREAAGVERFATDLPLLLVEAAVAGTDGTLGASTRRLADVLTADPEILRGQLAEIGSTRVAPARYHRLVAVAAGRIERRPEVLGALLRQLSHRLQTEPLQDRDPFCPIRADLLCVIAAAAERMPDVFRQEAAALPDLDRGLRDAVEGHDTYTGRRAALHLLACRGRLTFDAAAALRAALRDVPEVQSAALEALPRFREADPAVLDDLLDDPSTLTIHAATVLAASLADAGALSRQDVDRLTDWAWNAANETRSTREVWMLHVERGQIRPRRLGRLDESLSRLLLAVGGFP